MTSDPLAPAVADELGPPKTPVPLLLACVFGALGMALIVAGLASSVVGILLAGLAAGVLSLSFALFWRSELVSAWAAAKRSEKP